MNNNSYTSSCADCGTTHSKLGAVLGNEKAYVSKCVAADVPANAYQNLSSPPDDPEAAAAAIDTIHRCWMGSHFRGMRSTSFVLMAVPYAANGVSGVNAAWFIDVPARELKRDHFFRGCSGGGDAHRFVIPAAIDVSEVCMFMQERATVTTGGQSAKTIVPSQTYEYINVQVLYNDALRSASGSRIPLIERDNIFISATASKASSGGGGGGGTVTPSTGGNRENEKYPPGAWVHANPLAPGCVTNVYTIGASHSTKAMAIAAHTVCHDVCEGCFRANGMEAAQWRISCPMLVAVLRDSDFKESGLVKSSGGGGDDDGEYGFESQASAVDNTGPYYMRAARDHCGIPIIDTDRGLTFCVRTSWDHQDDRFAITRIMFRVTIRYYT